MKLRAIASLLIVMAALLAAATTQAQNQAAPVALPHRAAANSASTSNGKPIPQTSVNSSPLATGVCSYPFTIGSGSSYMNYCITVNGNFANFQSPAGVEMLDQFAAYEGYGICDNSSSTQYYDYEYGDSGNWNAPKTVTNTATEVKIERVTSDGFWTLTQTITKEAGPPPYAKIAMELKNNSAVTKYGLFLRYANFNPDQAANTGDFAENYDGDFNSTWGYNSWADQTLNGSDPYGLMLQNLGTPSSAIDGHAGVAIADDLGPAPCTAGNNAGTITYGIGSGVLLYYFDLGPRQTATVTARYVPF